MKANTLLAGVLLFTTPFIAPAQVVRLSETPVFRVDVVARTAKAVNYRHRGGATKIDFKGTSLMPKAHGEAKVESKQGYIEIEVEFDELVPARQFGPEYLTYVLWAITPEGRAKNLGEILLNGTESKLNVTTEFQTFGLIVTAEPYFAVSQPSDVVVMENMIRTDTVGKVEEIDAKYELLQRGQYIINIKPETLGAFTPGGKIPLELVEARNAVQIARGAMADRYAKDTFDKSVSLLQQAEAYLARKAGSKPVIMSAREAVQTAEDARLIAIKRIDDERLANERSASADREAKARADADAESQRRAAAERERTLAEQQRATADQQRATADQQRLAEEARRREAEAAANLSAEKAAAERARLEKATAEFDAASKKSAEERASLEAARIAALTAQQAAQADAERMRLAAAQAEKERAELKERLRLQLNAVLETRTSARGLIVNMSDVLFDTGQATLKPGAREKLAKVSGILLGHPGLKIQVEGHTDSVGSDAYNQGLSERRSGEVMRFLTAQGISASEITARGFGEAKPVATNDNAAGRQRNRRVELVVSGEALGVPTVESSAAR